MRGLALFLSALCGFTGLSYELLWYRAASVASEANAKAFPLLLGIYLATMAIGALLSRRFCADGTPPVRTTQILFGLTVVGHLVAYWLVPLYALHPLAVGPLPWLGAGAFILGAQFPMLAHIGLSPTGNFSARFGTFYLANILGSTAGSLSTGFVLMEYLPMKSLAPLLLGLGLLGALLLLPASGFGRSTRVAAWVGIVIIGIGCALLGQGPYQRAWNGLHRHIPQAGEIAEVVENRHGVITVSTTGVVHGGGTYDGAFNIDLQHDINGIYRAFVAPMLHPAPKRALMIGLSTGSWAQVVASYPEVEHLTIVEINPGYAQLIKERPIVASLLKNPKVTIEFEDGRNWLIHHPESRFDLIVANTSVHWITGASHVLSREFLREVKKHLAPGGVYYFNSTASNRATRGAQLEFAHVSLCAHFVICSDSPIPALTEEQILEGLQKYRIDGKPLSDDLSVLGALSGKIKQSLKRVPANLEAFEPITDDNMGAEWSW